MPFKSKAQQRYMFAKHPKTAKKWAGKYGVPKDLPEKAEDKSYSKKHYARRRKSKLD